MSVITVAVYCFFSVVALFFYRKISHPVVIFNLIWTVLIAVSRFGLVGLSVPPSATYEVFLKGGIVFNVLSFILFFIDRVIGLKTENRQPDVILSNKAKQRILLAFNIVMLIYYLFKLVQVYGIIGESGSYIGIRSFYYSTDNFASSLEYNVVTFIFDPLIYLNSVVFALNTKKKKYHTHTLVLIFVNMILRTIISGGRMIMFEFAICVLIAQITPYVGEHKSKLLGRGKNTKVVTIVFIAFLFLVASYITQLRGGTEDTIAGNGISTIISNFTGSFSYFSVLNNYGKYFKMLYGRATFAGIVDPVIMLLHFFKLTEVEIAQNSVGNILSEFYLLGNHSYNAMPTMYYFFITDFKEAGVLIGTAILSVYCFVIDRIRRSMNDYKSFGLYLMMMLTLIESPMTWLPFKTTYIVANLLIVVLVCNNRFSEHKN